MIVAIHRPLRARPGIAPLGTEDRHLMSLLRKFLRNPFKHESGGSAVGRKILVDEKNVHKTKEADPGWSR